VGIDLKEFIQPGLVHHNKVLVFEDKRYRYDAFGRLLEKRSSHFGVQRFEYDAEHRLIAVHQKPDARKDKGHAGSSTHFEYDALGRRIAKTHQETSASGHKNRLRTTRFGWDGMRLLSETREPLFEQQARHQSLYIYEDAGSYEPLARVDSASAGAAEKETNANTGAEADANAQADEKKKKKPDNNKVLYFHNDLSGKPEALSSAEQGQVIWRASYKVWGNTITEEWAGEYAQVDMRTVAQNIRFQGQYLDPETGLHYNTFRYYDPDVGRFTTPDPIGLNGGLNLYQYAPNPISWIDPWGLCKSARQLKNKMKRIRNQSAAGGNRGVSGSVSESDALKLGRKWVGPGAREMSSGKGLVSVDGTRSFRYPANKRGINRNTGQPWSQTGRQVNFESAPTPSDPAGSNVHLDVK
jgi:RHS repeat-associated protein